MIYIALSVRDYSGVDIGWQAMDAGVRVVSAEREAVVQRASGWRRRVVSRGDAGLNHI